MLICNLRRKLIVFTVLVSQSLILVRGSEPGMTVLPREIELEQRLMHLEAILSSEGCTAPVQEYAQRNAESSIYAGYRFLFVKPQMKESFEATIINPVAGQTTLIPLDYSFNVTPNVWLGYRTDQSIGMRLSYWGFNNDGNNQTLVSDGVNLPGATATTVIYPAAIIAPAPGDLLQTQNSLKVHTIDAEGTVDHRIQATDLTFGAGLRFASTSQEMHALASRVGVPIGQLGWSRKFEGFGPTLSATATHPILGGLSAVGNVRGSLLYGQKNLNRTVAGDVTPAPVAGSPTVSLNDADEVVAAGELGIGLRYTKAISQQADFYVQGTLDGQLWTEAGAPTLTFLGFQGIGLALGLAF
jgi:hypothetical protein